MKEQIRKRLESGRIAVYGNDEGSERFIKELLAFFSDIVHLTDFPDELALQPFSAYGIKTVSFDDYEIEPDRYIVVTGQFIRSQNRLRFQRFTEYRDYASIYVVRAVMQVKKLVVVMGTGAMSQLAAALKACPGFSAQHMVKYYNNKNFYRGEVRQYQEYQHVTKVSDLYLYSEKSVEGYQRTVVVPAEYMKNPHIRIGISGNDFTGLYPQLGDDGCLSWHCFREYEMSKIPYKYYVFSPRDTMMERFVMEKWRKEDIAAAFLDPGLFSREQIEENFEEAIEILRKSDELADIPLADEIIRRKSRIIVSRSLEEWHPEIIEYILKRVFETIEHEEPGYCYDDIAEAACEWSGNEIPPYPCVLAHFGLESIAAGKQYRIVSYENIRHMDMAQYAGYFADYCMKARRLDSLLHFEEDGMITNVLDYLEQSAYQYAGKVAFSDGLGGFIRYYQLREDARSIGSYIAKNFGVTRKPIAILMRKSAQSIAAFFGAVYSGNFYCPIDEAMPIERMRKIMDILNPELVIADGENMERAGAFGVPVISYEEAAEAEDDVRELARIKDGMLETDPLYVLFTSGSTGFPKGVLISHRAIIDSTEWIGSALGVTDRDILGNQSPFYFDNSTFDIYTGIRNGCCVQIIPKELFSSPVQLLEYMNTKKITTICWVPSALCLVANARALASWEPETLDKVFFCGEVMPNKQLNMWRAALPDAVFANLYGMTEITMNCTYYIVDRLFGDDEPLPIGRPCSNMEIIVLDENNMPVKAGGLGEICVRGCGLAYGYYNNPEQTEKAFVQNPANTQYREIIYRTGDLGRYNELGELVYAGRKDFQIKHKGHRIELGEIETAAGKIGGISMSACIYDDKRNKIVMFYNGKELLKKDVKGQLKEQLPEYMIPDKIIWLAELPHNANGKINRRQLKEEYCSGTHHQP